MGRHDPLAKLRRRRPEWGPKAVQMEARLAALIEAGQIDRGSTTVKISRNLQQVADLTYDALSAVAEGERVDFSLVVWTEGRFQYVSTAERPEAMAAFRALLAGWEAGMPDVKAHEVS